jgi:hypothetical protein
MWPHENRVGRNVKTIDRNINGTDNGSLRRIYQSFDKGLPTRSRNSARIGGAPLPLRQAGVRAEGRDMRRLPG